MPVAPISIRAAYEHNLKHISLQIERGMLTVLTGPSGSGKSTLAYDVIVAESHYRRERLKALARAKRSEIKRPKVEQIKGLPFTIGIKQELPNRALTLRAHTAASYLGLGQVLFQIFRSHGQIACKECSQYSLPLSKEQLIKTILQTILERPVKNGLTLTAVLPSKQPELEPFLKAGFSTLLVNGAEYDLEQTPPYKESDLLEVLIDSLSAQESSEARLLEAISNIAGFPRARIGVRYNGTSDLPPHFSPQPDLLLSPSGRCQHCGEEIPNILRENFSFRAPIASERIENIKLTSNLSLTQALKGEISELITLLPLKELELLVDLGLSSLSLERAVSTLSSGELQRLRIARSVLQVSSNTLLVLDEPSSGLHHSDINSLLKVFDNLTQAGISLLVVEHDAQIISRAKHRFYLGPGSGKEGGSLLSTPPPPPPPIPETRSALRVELLNWIELKDISKHNLRSINASFPLNCFSVLSGVSGSGKSTMLEVIAAEVKQRLKGAPSKIITTQKITRLITNFKGSRPNSPFANVASYSGLLEQLRKFYSLLPMSKLLGLTPANFSLATRAKDGARCPICNGRGVIEDCTNCLNTGYRPELFKVTYRALSLPQLLNFTVSELADFATSLPQLSQILSDLKRLNLSHLVLKQPLSTLSHGEFQRLRLLRDICSGTSDAIYLCDEPSQGLGPSEIPALIDLFRSFCARSNTVIAIEHNRSIIDSADYNIELGPGAGRYGGRVVSALLRQS